ncbi:MAG: rRNA maturation RNase YbeY [Chloroflexi bacterium]|nr:rRNA maturation RNase YbeY [Chloroflexota bacterium]
MTFQIEVQNDQEFPAEPEALVRAAVTVLTAHDVEPDSAMTIVLTDDAAVAALNLQFRGVDAPTDVLSFPMDENPVPGEAPYLGDLVIAYPYSAAQAERESFPMDQGLLLLVVHGTLHLLGYDHGTPEERAEMWDAQEAALNALHVPLSIVPKLEDDH